MQKRNITMKFAFLAILIINSFASYSQNLIVNPDFSNVTIFYQDGKKVYPNSWKSFEWPFPTFYHSASSLSEDFIGKPSCTENSTGIVGIHILHPSEGIVTRLKSTLSVGQIYDVVIELKIKRLLLNSDYKQLQYSSTGQKIDSIDLDHNFVINLITYFAPEESVNQNKDKRRFLIFDFPTNINTDSAIWIKLSQSYIAKGGEEYFAIGTDDSNDYVNILRTIKSDTVNYYHKWAYYLIRNVSVFPRVEPNVTNLCILNRFNIDSIHQLGNTPKFVLRNINFDLADYELNEDSKRELKNIADFLKKNLDFSLSIIGHTDTIGTERYNQVLSVNRAQSVYQYLIYQGIKSNRLSYEGKGETKPLNERQLEDNLGKNRRVEFEFKKEK
jgi:outer membrane protein OmpA-like peptidoglycan-associated protein